MILPQALRVAVAPTVGFLMQVVKGTALASMIGFVALFYFALCYPIALAATVSERRLARPGR